MRAKYISQRRSEARDHSLGNAVLKIANKISNEDLANFKFRQVMHLSMCVSRFEDHTCEATPFFQNSDSAECHCKIIMKKFSRNSP